MIQLRRQFYADSTFSLDPSALPTTHICVPPQLLSTPPSHMLTPMAIKTITVHKFVIAMVLRLILLLLKFSAPMLLVAAVLAPSAVMRVRIAPCIAPLAPVPPRTLVAVTNLRQFTLPAPRHRDLCMTMTLPLTPPSPLFKRASTVWSLSSRPNTLPFRARSFRTLPSTLTRTRLLGFPLGGQYFVVWRAVSM